LKEKTQQKIISTIESKKKHTVSRKTKKKKLKDCPKRRLHQIRKMAEY